MTAQHKTTYVIAIADPGAIIVCKQEQGVTKVEASHDFYAPCDLIFNVSESTYLELLEAIKMGTANNKP